MTRKEINKIIIKAAIEHFSSIEYDSGDIHGCYEFSFEELIAFAELLFEKGRQLGMKQERNLWYLTKSSQEIGYE